MILLRGCFRFNVIIVFQKTILFESCKLGCNLFMSKRKFFSNLFNPELVESRPLFAVLTTKSSKCNNKDLLVVNQTSGKYQL